MRSTPLPLDSGVEGVGMEISWAYYDTGYGTPRHKHTFDQFRLAFDGAREIKDGYVKAGECGFYPEGVSYGPQMQTAPCTGLTFQFQGATGLPYLKHRDLHRAQDELEAEGGTFEGGIYRKTLPDGKVITMDSHAACVERLTGQKIEFPKPRFSAPIVMLPENAQWVPDRKLPGVEHKHLGTFGVRRSGHPPNPDPLPDRWFDHIRRQDVARRQDIGHTCGSKPARTSTKSWSIARRHVLGHRRRSAAPTTLDRATPDTSRDASSEISPFAYFARIAGKATGDIRIRLDPFVARDPDADKNRGASAAKGSPNTRAPACTDSVNVGSGAVAASTRPRSSALRINAPGFTSMNRTFAGSTPFATRRVAACKAVRSSCHRDPWVCAWSSLWG